VSRTPLAHALPRCCRGLDPDHPAHSNCEKTLHGWRRSVASSSRPLSLRGGRRSPRRFIARHGKVSCHVDRWTVASLSLQWTKQWLRDRPALVAGQRGPCFHSGVARLATHPLQISLSRGQFLFSSSRRLNQGSLSCWTQPASSRFWVDVGIGGHSIKFDRLAQPCAPKPERKRLSLWMSGKQDGVTAASARPVATDPVDVSSLVEGMS